MIVDSVISGIKTIVNKFFPDKTVALQLKAKTENLDKEKELTELLKSYDLSIAEAKNKSIFVSGVRPFIGWTCGLAFFNDVILRPYLALIHITVPALTTNELRATLFGILGFGFYRTYEKAKGLTK